MLLLPMLMLSISSLEKSMLGAGHVEPGRYRLNMEGGLQKVPLHLTRIVKATWMLSGRGWLGY